MTVEFKFGIGDTVISSRNEITEKGTCSSGKVARLIVDSGNNIIYEVRYTGRSAYVEEQHLLTEEEARQLLIEYHMNQVKKLASV